MLLVFLFACATEIGFVQTLEKQQPEDTAILDTADTSQPSVEPSLEPSGEPSTEPSTEPSSELNGTVGLVVYELEQVACPACMGVSQEITINFDAKFHEKMNEQHFSWVPDAGTCSQNLNYTTINVAPKNIGQSLTVQGGVTFFTPYYNGMSYYGTHMEPQYARDTLLTVTAQDGSSFQLMSLHGFDSIEPWEMRYIDPSYAFAAVISRAGTNFQWAPSGSTGLLNITVAVYSPDGSQMLGYVSCTTNDTGYLSYFQGFPTWSLTAIHMTRVLHQRVPYQALGGYVDAQVEWSVVGTGHVE
jgi:hypothetical protein